MNIKIAFLSISFAHGLSIWTPLSAQEAGLICGGVEPFWSLEFHDERALFTAPDVQDIDYEIALRTPAQGRPDPVAITLISRRDTALAIIATRSCGDTMSDIVHPYSAEILTQRNSEAIMLTGCCRMRPK